MADNCLNCGADLTYPHYDGSDLYCRRCRHMALKGIALGVALMLLLTFVAVGIDRLLK